MGSIPKEPVICKCLELLNLSDERDMILDFRTQKLTTAKLVKLMIEAQLNQHSSYSVITEHLRSSDSLQKIIDLESISESQISRKLRVLPYQWSQSLFLQTIEKLKDLTQDYKGIPGIGRLSIIDSTELSLPSVAGQWAYCSKTKNAVKMHTRLVVADNDTVFPDRIIASTADIADSEVVMELVVDDDAIYVMDRGYIVYKIYKTWVERNIRFVARIQKRNKTVVVRERSVAESSNILRDADVKVSFKENSETIEIELRLVEFSDDQGNHYRILTNVYDLSAEQVSEMYRHRWMIELFFKWIKQHLKLVKLYSLEPEAVWTQMYLTLVAYALVLMVKLETGTSHAAWKVLQFLRIYMDKSWEAFLRALFREPTRTSKGRRKKAKKGRPRKHPVKLKGSRLIVR
jgi:hypothetical protein